MINNIFYWIDRLLESIMLRYRKKVFLVKTNNDEKSLLILGLVKIRGCANITIGKNVTIYPNVSFGGSGEIVIGDNVQIGEGTLIYCHKKIFIGNNVAIAGQCYIIDCNHGVDKKLMIQDQPLEFDEEGVFIGDDVWIAAGAKIIKGAKINNGVVIGAMSLVNSEISTYGIAVGVPAKVINCRS